MNKHVFISYVSENESVVNRLAVELESNGVNVWLDRNKIKPGSRWQDAIRRAIQSGNFFLACFSQEYSDRVSCNESYMNEELVIAIERLRKFSPDRIWFIPVKLSKCQIPDRTIGAGEMLTDLQWISLYENWNKGIEKILQVIDPIPHDIQVLITALESKVESIRVKAVESLGNLGNEKLLPIFLNCINDRSLNVRKNAIQAISDLGLPEAIPALIKASKDRANEEILYIINGVFETVRDNRAVPNLIFMLNDPNQSSKYSIVRALGGIGDKRAVEPLIRYLKDLNREADLDNRIEVLRSLSRIGDYRAIHVFLESYQSKDVKERMAAIKGLAPFRDSAVKKTVIKALKKDEWEWVRVLAVVSLYHLMDYQAAPFLIEALNDVSEFVRGQAAKALGMIQYIDALGALCSTLKDPIPFVRRDAAEALAIIGMSEAIPALQDAMNDNYQFIREAAGAAIQVIEKGVKRDQVRP